MSYVVEGRELQRLPQNSASLQRLPQNSASLQRLPQNSASLQSPKLGARYYRDTLFADLTLICDDGVRIRGHKIIVIPACQVLKQCFTPRSSSEIKISGFPSHIVKLMLEFVYTGTYTLPVSQGFDIGGDYLKHPLAVHAYCLCLGEQYKVADIAHYALQRFKVASQTSWNSKVLNWLVASNKLFGDSLVETAVNVALKHRPGVTQHMDMDNQYGQRFTHMLLQQLVAESQKSTKSLVADTRRIAKLEQSYECERRLNSTLLGVNRRAASHISSLKSTILALENTIESFKAGMAELNDFTGVQCNICDMEFYALAQIEVGLYMAYEGEVFYMCCDRCGNDPRF